MILGLQERGWLANSVTAEVSSKDGRSFYPFEGVSTGDQSLDVGPRRPEEETPNIGVRRAAVEGAQSLLVSGRFWLPSSSARARPF